MRMFIDTFQNMGGQFHILENRVPLLHQFEYFEYARKLRKRKQKKWTDNDFIQFKEKLESGEISKEEKKKILVMLAMSAEVRAFRLLELYLKHPDEELVNWASMALIESRIAIESELSGVNKVYISTGLGGKDGKLRFYVLIASSRGVTFEEYQRKVIETEFNYLLPQNDCDIDRLTISDNYIELVFLIPFTSDIRKILEKVVSECNFYGDFLSNTLTVTNVKEFSQDEVNQVITRQKKGLTPF